jgi:preprotein translocase subunit SecD
MLAYSHRNIALIGINGRLFWGLTWFLLALALLSARVGAEQITLDAEKTYAEIYELSNKPVVFVELTKNSTVQYARFTRAHVKQLFTFKVDGEELMTRMIVTSIDDGHFILSNFLTMKRAEQVANRLREGAIIQVISSSKP